MFRVIRRGFLWLLVLLVLAIIGFRLAAMFRETDDAVDILPDEGSLIATDMGQIFVQMLGPEDGHPVLLAHGTAAWSGLWRPTMQALADQGYRAIGFDMPPFGFSERDGFGDYSRQTQARRTLALQRALDTRPILVAHSFGAAPAVEAAMMEPDAFSGLVIVNGALGLGTHEEQGGMPIVLRNGRVREWIVSFTGTNPYLTRRLLAGLLYVKSAASQQVVDVLQRPMTIKGSTQAFSQWLPSLLVPPKDAKSTRPENYAGLTMPVAIIWGDKDTVTPLPQAKVLSGLMPDAMLNVLTDVGHIPQIEAPEPFQAALMTALNAMATPAE